MFGTKLDSLRKMIDEVNYQIENNTQRQYFHNGRYLSTEEIELYLIGKRNALINVYNDLIEEV